MAFTFLLTAGGSGGHLFPAQALASELGRRGHTVELATDDRAERFSDDFPVRKIHIVKSATLSGKSPTALIKTLWNLLVGTVQARGVIKHLKPDAVVGFGGYPTFPPMFAARLTGTPSVLHEANGVIGRANKMLAKGVNALASRVPLKGLDAQMSRKVVLTGNPVRDAVIAKAGAPYPALDAAGPFNLFVFGGSQGAKVFSDLMPEAIARLPEALRARIHLVQQVRDEDMERVQAAYEVTGFKPELASFFKDIPELYEKSHLVICRSGASSVTELTVIGRPAFLVPLPNALDQDQLINAKSLEAVGGAWTLEQPGLTSERLCDEIARVMEDPECLRAAAAAALSEGKPDSVARLADLVEQVAAHEFVAKGVSA
ncbi:MAG: undecaprenyldiphospho-muramoylpentapeptide beta-N-acetylglucosaminyltransferase [Rhodobacteraceae bacterium]|nr:undecaprenyldiphospho-muramoylpentapeptide beta-N-acetylglucosaminyltransferase [Paracoccaceae bacterium]